CALRARRPTGCGEGQRQGSCGEGPAAQAVVELEPVNARARKAFSQQREKMERRRNMPGFWANVIANHPQMSALITDQDEDMLSYMINLEVKEAKHPVHLCQIMLFFRSNPYFQNKVITKEYLVNVTEYRASHSTPIQWCQDYEVEAYRRRHNNSGLNFFNWFSDHNFAGSNRIAEILCKDLWRNPLQYYRRMKPPEEETEISGEAYSWNWSCLIPGIRVLTHLSIQGAWRLISEM
uniref:TSPY n=1 Tax=Macaca fascicularis TaxID=9541 RepID=A0A7N9I997_MACFA